MADQTWEVRKPLGILVIRQEVLTALVQRAVQRVAGAQPLRSPGIMGIFSGPEDTTQITFRRDGVDVDLRIAVVQGYAVHEVARGVQRAVREDLEGLAGIPVGRVDVSVRQVVPAQEALVLEEGEDGEG